MAGGGTMQQARVHAMCKKPGGKDNEESEVTNSSRRIAEMCQKESKHASRRKKSAEEKVLEIRSVVGRNKRECVCGFIRHP